MEWLTGFIASSVGKVTSWISGTANQLLDNVFGFCKALVQMFWIGSFRLFRTCCPAPQVCLISGSRLFDGFACRDGLVVVDDDQ